MKKFTAFLVITISVAIFSGSVAAQSLGSAVGVHFKTETGIGTIKVFAESHAHCIQETMRVRENVKRLGYEYLGTSNCQKSFAARATDIAAYDGNPLPLPFTVMTVMDRTFGFVPLPEPKPRPYPYPYPYPYPPFPFPFPGPVCLSCPPPLFDLEQITYVYEKNAAPFINAYEKYNIAEYQERLEKLRFEYDLEGFDRTILNVQSQISR